MSESGEANVVEHLGDVRRACRMTRITAWPFPRAISQRFTGKAARKPNCGTAVVRRRGVFGVSGRFSYHSALVVDHVAVAGSRPAWLFDDPIEALGAGAGAVLGERDQDGRPTGLDGFGQSPTGPAAVRRRAPGHMAPTIGAEDPRARTKSGTESWLWVDRRGS
jgi:hypothetical protein